MIAEEIGMFTWGGIGGCGAKRTIDCTRVSESD